MRAVTLYSLALFTHSLLRWLIVLLGLVVCLRSFAAWRRGRAWLPLDERLHVALVGSVDAQFLLGLVLYGLLSPLSRAFWTATAAAMKDPLLRFYGLEHVVMALLGVAVLHVGRKRSMRAGTTTLRHRRVWTFTLAALLIIAAAIPWPGLAYGRPLFRPLW
jgi:hypothetical protein